MNIDQVIKEADLIVENTYRTPYQEHLYLEPQGMTVVWDPDGQTIVRGTMQCPYYVRDAVATVLGTRLSKVRVIQTTTGGGFGGKEDVPSIVAAQAAIVARKTGRPAKLILSREEDILAMSKRHPAVIKYKSAFAKDGTLLGVKVLYVLDAGAYSTLSPIVLWRGTVHAGGPYKMKAADIEGVAVATNKVPCGAFRGFGEPQVHFAFESQMDEAARRLGMDPVQLRLKNALREGDETVTGQKLGSDAALVKAINTVVEASKWKEVRDKLPENEGMGISAVYYGVGLGAGGKVLDRAGAYVQVMYDGSASFSVGTTEMGQGMISQMTQIVSEELGIPMERISALPTDTAITPDSGPTVASRTTIMSGNALINACRKVKRELLEAASELLDRPVEDIEVDIGVFRAGSKSVSLDEVLKQCFVERRPLAATGWFESPPTSWDDKTGQGNPYITYAWAANVARVRVDPDTGEVKVLEFWAAHDVGKAFNPQQLEGQIIGGTLQGIGYALMEQIIHKDGRMQNNRLSTYIVPTIKDAPKIHPIILETPYELGPYGAKGFAEQPLIGAAPAISNAVSHATKRFFKELPLTPERVFDALKEGSDED